MAKGQGNEKTVPSTVASSPLLSAEILVKISAEEGAEKLLGLLPLDFPALASDWLREERRGLLPKQDR